MENISLSCPICHQHVASDFYFCPYCGKDLKEKPLSTTVFTQAWMYAAGIILPMFFFVGVSRWPGIRYARSGDEKARRIGFTAIVLMALSTIVLAWAAYAFIGRLLQTLSGGLIGQGGLGGF